MKNFDSKIKFSIETSPLGTGGAIKKAARLINGRSFLVLNGDIITTIDIRELYSSPNSIALIELRTKFGTVDLDNDKITSFKEKRNISGVWMNSGIYHLDKKIISDLPSRGAIEDTTFRKYAKNRKLVGIKFKNGLWFSIDSHKDIEECANTISDKRYAAKFA
jgi:NDP-sugar pyrophosphorylase family protein